MIKKGYSIILLYEQNKKLQTYLTKPFKVLMDIIGC